MIHESTDSTYENLVLMDRVELAKRCISLQNSVMVLKKIGVTDEDRMDGLKKENVSYGERLTAQISTNEILEEKCATLKNRNIDDAIKSLVENLIEDAISNIDSRDLDLDADHINGVDDLVSDCVTEAVGDAMNSVDANDISSLTEVVEEIVDDKISAIEIDSSIRK